MEGPDWDLNAGIDEAEVCTSAMDWGIAAAGTFGSFLVQVGRSLGFWICPASFSNPNNAKPPFTIKRGMKITA
jgi:hypothetical protein